MLFKGGEHAPNFKKGGRQVVEGGPNNTNIAVIWLNSRTTGTSILFKVNIFYHPICYKNFDNF